MPAFSVSQKIFIARQLNRLLRFARGLFGLGMQVRCRRDGLNWELDLNEGIDLSIYLLGAYEPHTIKAYAPLIRPGAVVFDIGANIGAHTLHFARLAGPTGRVFAFEPTEFACAKLRANLALNPALAERVSLQQFFLVAHRAVTTPPTVAASWPVADSGETNAWHGRAEDSSRAAAVTADDFCARAGVTRIDFVKLDVDGHEWSVLQGFSETLARFRPVIVVEIAPFIYAGVKAREFDDFIRFLDGLGYCFTNVNTGRTISPCADELRRTITPGGGINALLLPPRTGPLG
ncbi:MAG: FkbM family methyltransferase [Opitutae bacterium]|nr:FkbM family methyltransferase [Opitutae bacterium]